MARVTRRRRMGEKQQAYFSKNAHRSLPPPDCPSPHSVPTSVMQTLQDENLSKDPVKFNARLQELLAAYKLNGG
jgi:hypothetical protein